MAEAFGRFYAKKLKKKVEIFSAGSEPSGFIHPLAVRVMAEKGTDISSQYSKSLDEIPVDELDVIVTLCGDAAERCPVVPGAKIIHWGLPDPAKVEGTEEEKLRTFRQVRDEIEKRVRELLYSL